MMTRAHCRCETRHHPSRIFNNPKQALAAFEAAPDSFELVITDFGMPEMDGFELSHHMFAIAPKIKILLMTGSHISEEVAAAHGFCGLLHKPFPFTVLRGALDAVEKGNFFKISGLGSDIFFQQFHTPKKKDKK
jgi:DNA-binding NtrC family response regulator